MGCGALACRSLLRRHGHSRGGSASSRELAAEQKIKSDRCRQRGCRHVLDGVDPEQAPSRCRLSQAVRWAARRPLRDIIGRTQSRTPAGREKIEEELQQLIDQRSNPWGATVQSVEMRDVIIPESLQDAMSREAQASREKQARVILGQAEVEIAESFAKASQSYHQNPTALHLRAMNML